MGKPAVGTDKMAEDRTFACHPPWRRKAKGMNLWENLSQAIAAGAKKGGPVVFPGRIRAGIHSKPGFCHQARGA